MAEPKRIQRKRSKGWRMPENTVYVGRGSKWGNSFVIGEEYVRHRMTPGGGQRSGVVVDREHAVRLFKQYTAREVRIQIGAYQELRGKNLACWCPLDQPCHADVLLEIANG